MYVPDLPRQFFMVHFDSELNYMAALTGGPWKLPPTTEPEACQEPVGSLNVGGDGGGGSDNDGFIRVPSSKGGSVATSSKHACQEGKNQREHDLIEKEESLVKDLDVILEQE
ncbi:hypothetical protein V2J09_020067 [Rumex salicifolius]